MFQYADKVWMQGTTEGSFGTYTHARPGPITVTYTSQDFTHSDYVPKSNPPVSIPLGTLNIDTLEKTDLYEAATNAYKT
jgi:hypothetical protein